MTAEPESSRAAKPQEQSSSGPRVGFITALAVFAVVVIVIIYGYLERPGWIGVSGKKFWDYLDLLIVPAALALGVYWLNRRQTERDQQAEDAQQERALAVESQRAQGAALQAYLDQMGQLLLDKEKPLRQSKAPDAEERTLARAWTLTVLEALDASRRSSVVRFLYEAQLLAYRPSNELRVVSLAYAHLSGCVLSGHRLRGIDLSGAFLVNVDLRGADLSDANLTNAVLTDANLTNAYLGDADLSGATGCTMEQLTAARSLAGATMPNGQKYEDWIKDKEGGGKNVENE